MYFKKYPYPANFEFVRQFNAKGGCRTAGGRRQLSVRASADDIYHLTVTGGPGWDRNDSEAKPKLRRMSSGSDGTDTQLKVNAKGGRIAKSLRQGGVEWAALAHDPTVQRHLGADMRCLGKLYTNASKYV